MPRTTRTRRSRWARPVGDAAGRGVPAGTQRAHRRVDARPRPRHRRDDRGGARDRSQPADHSHIFFPGDTMASVIAHNFGEATGRSRAALIGLGVVLFAITIVDQRRRPAPSPTAPRRSRERRDDRHVAARRPSTTTRPPGSCTRGHGPPPGRQHARDHVDGRLVAARARPGRGDRGLRGEPRAPAS